MAEIYSRVAEAQRPNANPAFLHSRVTSSKGTERLVSVDMICTRGGGVQFFARTWKPAGFVPRSRAIPSTSMVLELPIARVIYAGQIDPTDESHFTIAFDADNGKGVIDGWVINDDLVKLELRD